MAQAKKKRRSKHRGTAAGEIEARGRTSRPPSPEERKRQSKEKARATRVMKPPTWSASAKRAALAAVLMFGFLILTTRHKHGSSAVVSAALFAIVALLIYLPAGYYMELYLYRRRLNKQRQETAKR